MSKSTSPGLQNIKVIDELALKDKKLFLRCDFNVPLEDGEIADDFRIRATLPTIEYALKAGAKVVLASHLGRPKGEGDRAKYSLFPIAQYLQKSLNKEVILFEDPAGPGIKGILSGLKENQLVLLENVRFDPGEEKNSMEMAVKLASWVDVYVSDAFGAAHRAHATTQALPSLIKEKGVGFLMKGEIENLDKVLYNPARPFVAILGGAKVSDKIKMIDSLLPKIDVFLVGGAMAYTFLVAKDIQVGNSLVEKDKIQLAREIMERIRLRGKTILLPMDHVVAPKFEKNAEHHTTPTAAIQPGLMGLDIGPKTIEKFSQAIRGGKTIFWNGPMGAFETPPFEKGTFAIALALSESKGVTVVGGGDSANAIKEAGVGQKITHISTGGGASLEYLEGAKLPGIEVLRSKGPDVAALDTSTNEPAEFN